MSNEQPTVQFRPDGALGKLSPEKLALLIGEVTGLMMASRVHRALRVRDIAEASSSKQPALAKCRTPCYKR